MTCEHCGEVLVRCIVQWEDGSASIMWRCACKLNDADRRELRELREGTHHVGLAGASIVYPDDDDRLGTRGWA